MNMGEEGGHNDWSVVTILVHGSLGTKAGGGVEERNFKQCISTGQGR